MNALSAVARREEPLYTKLILAIAIVAMLFAFLPTASALAAPGNDPQPWENVDLEREWRDKLRLLYWEGLFYNEVRFFPVDFNDSAELAQAWNLLHKHGFALKQANTVVFNHTGFDIQGNVLNERRAYESVQNLSMHLHTMRGLRNRIAEEGYKVHRVR